MRGALLLGLALIFGMALAAPVAAAVPESHDGMVVSAGQGKLVMTDAKSGKEHSHDIPATARIMVNGKAGKLEDLTKGRMIKVTTDEGGRVLEVATVDLKKEPTRFWR